jgi:beta-glucosidase/6-phospho-beta-glucosidase/beta-galactosidase
MDGKGPSTFDVWSHTSPARVGQPNADVSADHYNKWKADLAFLGQLNATAYRFSVSWARIFPNCTGAVNQAGIDFYSNIIDEVLRQGAEPFLTMFHWDLPQGKEFIFNLDPYPYSAY